MSKIPTAEEVYNEYHKQTFFVRNGVYPKTIKSFTSLYDDNKKIEYINYFINFLKRNVNSVDWKLYIKALAIVLQNRYDLKYLGSFAGNKIYRDYIKSLNIIKSDPAEIRSDIIATLLFLSNYIKENNITFKEYFELDKELIPISLKHIYARNSFSIFLCMFPTRYVISII